MTTVTEHIRTQMYKRLGVDSTERRDPHSISAEIKGMTSKLDGIVSLARPRLIMGGLRHGSSWEHGPLMKYMQEKFDTYKETGNFEMLVDLFNFVTVEGRLQTHPKFHFNAVDRK